ncbi:MULTISPECIES: excinuclease ABC subunit UvrA [Variovorax]|jgi:excinuclease ABC subunit A|uniref:excinuclease ABC subunit UvrA n=1 Tax=Variovorax TaxID=34072 RepID=UPI00086F0637|nr:MULTISPECIES: excinuclease ABC subunit UvrA [Variovorax]MBN8754583.1 excinuclease ABC subunit UvrA [Variovorax sp.]ODU19309.1 MAG: excinuclease ABC subunit A [Variovorax sp. SCN 67-85]ODV25212.1 MAG: excinuclease ABC subunit A [Variovorax sp. SCN 67-20]OJZ03030.1 MAG: excinuclease ABC subunit A [Variovorax sp. 67-131]UKI07501.1 excinuclease ABC subunit UvrA [Variovorax paradoxus]
MQDSNDRSDRFVRVRGAREHNLRNVDVDIPRDALVVFSGISGSGKSSLAFGTLYAEAQRRYFESVAPYARRLIDQVGVPAVDAIDGLPPAVALQQQRGTPGARSSVGSVTTLSSLLRMLYSRAGDYPARQPMLYAEDFSPNTPQGACPTCHGLGRVFEVTEQSMVPDDSLSIRERAIAAWPPAWHGQNLRDILVTMGIDVDKPWRNLPKKTRNWILFTEEQPTVPVYAGFTPAETRAAVRSKMEPSYQGTFMGARKYVLHTFATTHSALMKNRAARFMVGGDCPQCHGKRLKREALSVRFAGHDIGEIARMSLARLADVLRPVARGESPGAAAPVATRRASLRQAAPGKGASHASAPDVRRTPNQSAEKRIAAQRIAHEMLERVTTLLELGLGYLSLDRSTPTLSPGELQRLRLATQIRSNLFGVVYVLDEPSAGLHPADGEALVLALDTLKRSGNSLFVVEHDLDLMRRADWLVDVGPDAGEKGGLVLYSGPPEGLRHVAQSHTARYLFSAHAGPVRPPRTPRGWLKLEGLTRNNLSNLAAAFPLGVLSAVTGVSGSGKSSLVSQALVELVAAHLGHEPPPAEEEEGEEPAALASRTSGHIVQGMEGIRRLVRVDQKPIGRTPRSNLATYTGLFDHVRKLFAGTRAAKARRFDPGRFSFNVAKGRCPTCEGEGFVSVELLFMPSVYAPCPACHGSRFNAQTLSVRLRDRTIADVLAMTVDEAHTFFEADVAIERPLQLLKAIGLGYLRLGQPATELSGGEAQRIKLATELQRAQRGDTLYVLDEPTTGLHPADVDKLTAQLDNLVDAGNTVIVIEHEMRLVAGCDWVIDMGPGAGGEGGRIVASGAPSDVARSKKSRTAPYLARWTSPAHRETQRP